MSGPSGVLFGRIILNQFLLRGGTISGLSRAFQIVASQLCQIEIRLVMLVLVRMLRIPGGAIDTAIGEGIDPNKHHHFCSVMPRQTATPTTMSLVESGKDFHYR